MTTDHNHDWTPRGELSNNTTVAYGCACGVVGIRKWTDRGLTPIKVSVMKDLVGDGYSLASEVRMSNALRRQDEMKKALTSEQRFERLMGVRS